MQNKKLIVCFVVAAIVSFLNPAKSFSMGAGLPESQGRFSSLFSEERRSWILETFHDFAKKSPSYNQDYFVFVDFQQHVSKRRFYIIYPSQNRYWNYKVAHGYGSDLNSDGYVEKVSDEVDSGTSSEGVFVTKDLKASKKFGTTLRVCGLSKTNRHAYSRHILVHPALKEGKDYLNQKKPSAGCFSLNVSVANKVMGMLSRRPTLIISSLEN